MEIAFITAEYPPKSRGGAGISSRLIVNGLRNHGHSVDVFSLTGEQREDPTRHKEGHVELPDGLSRRLPNAIGQNISVYRYLPDTDAYDVVHAYSPEHVPASVFRADVPLVATFVNFTWVCIDALRYLERGCPKYTFSEALRAASSQYSGVASLIAPIVERVGKMITNQADAITVQTEGMRDILSRCGYQRSTIEVVPNLVDPQFRISDNKSPSPDSRQLVTIGRMVEEKGIFDIVRIFSQIPAETKEDWSLKVYGDGPQRDAIETYLSDENITDISLNYCSYEDMPRNVYQEAAAVIHGAKWPEPFSRVWLEAMVTGTPIVCSNNPSARCVLDDMGIFYNPFDLETLRQSLIEVMDAPKLRTQLSEAGRARASEYMPTEVIPKYINIYEKIR